MCEKLSNEDDTLLEILKKTFPANLIDLLYDGFSGLERKLFQELKDALDNPVKFDVEKIKQDVFDILKKRETEEREKLKKNWVDVSNFEWNEKPF